MIPSDNNGIERGIRKLKIKLKDSCTFCSDFGADAFLEPHSVVETRPRSTDRLHIREMPMTGHTSIWDD